ncbi:MAG: DUF6941 family protein [Armatimonadota bacterium]
MHESTPPLGMERPSCLSVIVCNEIIEDKWTNNKTLISLFNSIGAPELPATHPRMFLMVSLTDGRGHWPLTLEIEAPSGEQLFKAEGDLHFDDPLAVQDVVVEVRGLPLPEEGEYRVGVALGGQPLASRRFTVVLEEGEDEDEG